MTDLDDMIVGANDIGLLYSWPVLQVEGADKIRSPAPQNTIEDLESYPRSHAKLREGVRQRK